MSRVRSSCPWDLNLFFANVCELEYLSNVAESIYLVSNGGGHDLNY